MFSQIKKLQGLWKFFYITKLTLGHAEIDRQFYKVYSKAIYPAFAVSQVATCVLLGLATVTTDDVEVKIQQGMNMLMFTPSLILFSLTHFNIGRCEKMLLWCESLNSKFPNECFERAKKQSTFICKGIYYGLLGATVLILVVQSAALSLASGNLVTAYDTPPPFGTVWERVGIFIVQNFFTLNFVVSNCTGLALTCVVSRYASACLEHMKDETCNLTPESDLGAFRSRIKSIVNLHSSVLEQLNFFKAFSSNYVGLFEGCFYAALLLVWITIFFLHPLAAAAVGSLLNVSPFVVNVCLNEKLDDAYEGFRAALYNVRWFEMRGKQRRDVLLIMIMASQKKLLHCGPFYVLNYEQLLTTLKRVYSFGLSLNKVLGA